MMTIGNRIKAKRKELGLTQAELGEKLHVTDRAVSKWEQNEGNPDMSIVADLAAILGVTLDYLILGKENDTISLDDMDKDKRALYLVKKDDGDSFVNYGYNIPEYIIDYECIFDDYSRKFQAREARNNRNEICNEIYTGHKLNVFSVCLDALMNSDYSKNESYYIWQRMGIGNDGLKGVLFYEHIDEFLKMVAELGRTDVLEFVGFKYYAIGSKASRSKLIGNYPDYSFESTIHIHRKTVEHMLCSKNVPQETKDYIYNCHFYQKQNARLFFMNDLLLECLYKNGNKEQLESYLKDMHKNLEHAAESYKNFSTGWYDSKEFKGDIIRMGRKDDVYNSSKYVVPRIAGALKAAIEANDDEWIRKFNAYNKKYAELLPDSNCTYYTDDQIELMEMEANPETKEKAILLKKYVKNGILNIHGLLNDFKGASDNEVTNLRAYVKKIKEVYKPIVDEYPICEYELVLCAINKKDLKTIYKYAFDTENKGLEEAVISANEDKILQIVSEKLPSFADFEDAPSVDKLTLDYFERYKEFAVKKGIDKLERIIEEITQEKKQAKDYANLMSELNEEYLLAELNKGNEENVVIKLCVKLEATFKYKYKYEGDLFTMLSHYIDTALKEIPMNNPWDDEDNNYYRLLEEDRKNKELNRVNSSYKDLLHKLRSQRNSYVHPEKSNVKMTKEELENCIKLVTYICK